MIFEICLSNLTLLIALYNWLDALMSPKQNHHSLSVHQRPQLFDIYRIAPLSDADPEIVLGLQQGLTEHLAHVVGSAHLVAPVETAGLHRLVLGDDLPGEVFAVRIQGAFKQFKSHTGVRLKQVVHFAVLG